MLAFSWCRGGLRGAIVVVKHVTVVVAMVNGAEAVLHEALQGLDGVFPRPIGAW